MSRFLNRSWFLLPLVIALGGCADNPQILKGKVTKYEQEQVTLNREKQELTARAAKLDQDNQELLKLVASWQQNSKALEEKQSVLQDQLRAVNAQLVQARSERDNTDKTVKTLTASMQRQDIVSIKPNNSYLSTMPVINLPEVYVRKDGDVIRVELPGNRLFEPGSNRLRPGGAELIASAAAEVLRTYPDQVIAVEGHTDNTPVAGLQFQSNRELSSARAMSVYSVLVSRVRVPEDQLTVVGHGSNRPVVSNGSSDGKQRNNRVELVIYPDRRPGK